MSINFIIFYHALTKSFNISAKHKKKTLYHYRIQGFTKQPA